MHPSGNVLGRSISMILVLFAMSLLGCTAAKHVLTTPEYKGVMLPAETERGAERLHLEKEFDETINTVVGINGLPDYLLVESVNSVKLFYLKQDRIYSFVRGWSCDSKVSVISGIPEQYIRQFSVKDQKTTATVRSSGKADGLRKSGSTVTPNTIEKSKEHQEKTSGDYGTVPANLKADDIKTIFLKLRKNAEKKSEYETTGECLLGRDSGESFCVVKNKNVPFGIFNTKYNTDTKKYKIEVSSKGDIDSFWLVFDGPMDARVEKELKHKMTIAIEEVEKGSRSYSGQTALGATAADVISSTYDEYLLVVMNTDDLVKSLGLKSWPIYSASENQEPVELSLSPNEAKKLDENFSILFNCTLFLPKDSILPVAVESTSYYKATINDPYEIFIYRKGVLININEVWIFDSKSKKIYAKYIIR